MGTRRTLWGAPQTLLERWAKAFGRSSNALWALDKRFCTLIKCFLSAGPTLLRSSNSRWVLDNACWSSSNALFVLGTCFWVRIKRRLGARQTPLRARQTLLGAFDKRFRMLIKRFLSSRKRLSGAQKRLMSSQKRLPRSQKRLMSSQKHLSSVQKAFAELPEAFV